MLLNDDKVWLKGSVAYYENLNVLHKVENNVKTKLDFLKILIDLYFSISEGT